MEDSAMKRPNDPDTKKAATPIVRVIGLDPPNITLEELILLEQFAGDLIHKLAASNDNEGETP